MKLQPEPEKKEEIKRWETMDDLSKKSLEECVQDSPLLEWSKEFGWQGSTFAELARIEKRDAELARLEKRDNFATDERVNLGLSILNIQDQGDEEMHAEQPSEVQASQSTSEVAKTTFEFLPGDSVKAPDEREAI